MKPIRQIPVTQIALDRMPVDPKSLMYALAMLRGDAFPPIRVARKPTGAYEIRDGRHRVTAAKLISRGKIAAMFSDTPLRRPE